MADRKEFLEEVNDMPGFGGFYKGEKKKQKKGKDIKQSPFGEPVIQMPEIISRKKKDTF